MQDYRYLVKRGGNAWHATKPVPRHLRPIIKKSNLRKSLKTTDPVIARDRRWAVLAQFQAIIDAAQKQHDAGPVIGEALSWREHVAKVRAGDLSGCWDGRYPEGGAALRTAALWSAEEFIEEDAAAVAASYGPAVATAFTGVATGTAMPLVHSVDSWLREGGSRGPMTERNQRQARSIVARFAKWCEGAGVPLTVEAITKAVAGRYVTEVFVAENADPATTNRHVTNLSSYWTWLVKRTGVTVNPWSGQGRSKARRNAKPPPRPFTDAEITTLMAGPAKPEMADVMRIAAHTGMRLEEIYSLKIGECGYGLFNVKDSKTEAGIRVVPIHSAIVAIVERRCAGKAATAFLIDEAGPARKDRSKPMSDRFTDYRRKLGVDEREPGRRHSRVTFHSFRRWFVTKSRQATPDVAITQFVVGHETGNITDDVYSGGPTLEQRRACVEAVRLPS